MSMWMQMPIKDSISKVKSRNMIVFTAFFCYTFLVQLRITNWKSCQNGKCCAIPIKKEVSRDYNTQYRRNVFILRLYGCKAG